MIKIADTSLYQDKEALYIAVRDAEQRVVSDELLRMLPYTPPDYALHNEWKIRAESTERFINFVADKKLNILDLGCGNGWMTNRLYKAGHQLTGVDLNLVELAQAEQVFGSNDRLHWVYADVLKDDIPNAPFDLIVLGASCQYFESISILTERLKSMLTPKGTIHLLDSFFYTAQDVHAAKERTRDYYATLGQSEMSNYYHHHLVADLKAQGYKKKYPSLFRFGKKPEWWMVKL